MNGTTGVPKSVCHCKLDKESNFFSGILCFLGNFQDLPDKSSTNELNNVCCCCKDFLPCVCWDEMKERFDSLCF